MKNFYLLFFLSFISIIISYPISNQLKNINKKEEYILNNLVNIIDDSIDPGCTKSTIGYSKDSEIKIDNIEIKIPKIKKWSKNLIEAYTFSPTKLIIDNKFKKRFDGEVIISANGKKCTFPAKIRIHGDSFDHIKLTSNGIQSSLDVRLKEGNINGIVNFKLFLPKTRNGNSEIITINLMKALGYLSPRTIYMNTKINENNKTQMILQEKIAKEMIENFSLRESAIIGSNESLMWEARQKINANFTSFIYPKSKNIKWASKGPENKRITINGLNILSEAMNESWSPSIDKEISFSDSILSNGDKFKKSHLSKFRVFLIAMGAEHALHNNNRRFYYEPLGNYLIPVYYDGNSLIEEYANNKYRMNFEYIKSSTFLREVSKLDLFSAIEDLEKLDIKELKKNIEKSGLFISTKKLNNIKNIILKNIRLILDNIEENKYALSLNKDYSKRLINSNKYGLAFYKYGNEFEICTLHKCENIFLKNKEIFELINSGLIYDNKIYIYNGSKKRTDLNTKPIKSFSYKDEINLGKVKIIKIGKPKIIIDELNKIIDVEIYDKKQKLIIIDSDLSYWTIKIKGPITKGLEINESRFDERLLTGMLTIKNSSLKNINIEIKNGLLEDSLNIIGSKGSINKIDISNSFQDAIDFDFSNLYINEINILNSGNDCLDVSSGIYVINTLKANNCIDKGISVGEKSHVRVMNIDLIKSSLAFASKDSSHLIIENGFVDKYNICASAYRKKQEFGPASIQLNKNLCNSKNILIQNQSKLILK